MALNPLIPLSGNRSQLPTIASNIASLRNTQQQQAVANERAERVITANAAKEARLAAADQRQIASDTSEEAITSKGIFAQQNLPLLKAGNVQQTLDNVNARISENTANGIESPGLEKMAQALQTGGEQGLAQTTQVLEQRQNDAIARKYIDAPEQTTAQKAAEAATIAKAKSDATLQNDLAKRAAGRTTINVLDKPPTIDQMTKLIGPNGETPQLGETLNELKDQGYQVRSVSDQKLEKQAGKVAATLDKLEELADPVFTGSKGLVNRVFDDASKTWNRLGQEDKTQALFEAFSKGTVASLVRGVGEKGSLSNKDIERGLSLIPNTGEGLKELPDTREVALGKIAQLRDWFDVHVGKKPAPDGDKGDLSDEEFLQLQKLRKSQ